MSGWPETMPRQSVKVPPRSREVSGEFLYACLVVLVGSPIAISIFKPFGCSTLPMIALVVCKSGSRSLSDVKALSMKSLQC